MVVCWWALRFLLAMWNIISLLKMRNCSVVYHLWKRKSPGAYNRKEFFVWWQRRMETRDGDGFMFVDGVVAPIISTLFPTWKYYFELIYDTTKYFLFYYNINSISLTRGHRRSWNPKTAERKGNMSNPGKKLYFVPEAVNTSWSNYKTNQSSCHHSRTRWNWGTQRISLCTTIRQKYDQPMSKQLRPVSTFLFRKTCCSSGIVSWKFFCFKLLFIGAAAWQHTRKVVWERSTQTAIGAEFTRGWYIYVPWRR